MLDNAESLRIWSGGRFRGWVFRSKGCLGDSGPALGKLRLLRADPCPDLWFSSLALPDFEEEEEDFFNGDRDRGEWDSSSLVGVFLGFLGDLEKRFI
jgi:hypothetical protein